MNAALVLASALPRHLVLAMLPAVDRDRGASTKALQARLARRFALDLAGLLNRASREALLAMAACAQVSATGAVGEVRARLWLWGARAEAAAVLQADASQEHAAEPTPLLGSPLQPVPCVVAGKLVFPGPVRGLCPPASRLPRPVPAPVPAPRPASEPACLEELLANATRLIGVRLGAAGRDKGAYGTAVAAMLGVAEHNAAAPDWRGIVEIKTVPVVRDRAGWWLVKEDPAVGMAGGSAPRPFQPLGQPPGQPLAMTHHRVGAAPAELLAAPLAKLERVLWVARVADHPEPVILGWYYQERDRELHRLMLAHLHTRPKGGAGTTARGWYLHKRFFLHSGFFRVLNG